MVSTVANARILPIAQTGFKRDIKALFASIVDDLRGILLRAAEPDGTIPLSRLNRVQAASAEIILRLFVGADGRNAFADDGVSPLSPYARILNKWYVYVVVAQVMAAHKWLKKTLPEDVFAYLQTGSVRSVAVVKEAENPWLRRAGESDDDYRARLESLRIFSPNPLAQYEPMHTWVDPNGYRLSDRIWRTGQATRDQIDALVSAGVRQGRSAMDIAAALEAYLVPTETGIRTLRPYGPQWLPDQAAYSAMRLARTEISRANNQAAYISAANNPYCTGIDIARSANGDPDCPICPQHATIDGSGNRTRPPYIFTGSFRVPPYHPHCVTPGQLVETTRGFIPIEDVKKGDFVRTHTGQYRKVLNAWSKPYKGLVHKIETGAGWLELTSEHPVMSLHGWLDAKLVQPTEQILYTSVGTTLNGILRITESQPTEATKISISPSVLFGLMPPSSIAFDSNLAGNQCEINHILPYPILTLEQHTALFESLSHLYFNGCGDTIPTIVENGFSHSAQSRITSLLDLRNLLSNFGTFGGVGFSQFRICDIDLLESITGDLRTRISPEHFTSLASATQLDTSNLHEAAEHTVLNREPFTNLGISELFSKIQIEQDFSDGNPIERFNSLLMLLNGIYGIASAAQNPLTHLPANRAGMVTITHDNLLSSSPDDEAGAESGNSVVGQFMRLPQALLHYSTVERVSVRHYGGLVYNMHVEEDNSYTVNGAIVHNCMCSVRPAMASAAEVTQRLRGVMQDARQEYLEPYMTPARANQFIADLLGPILNQIVPQIIGGIA